MARSWPSRSSRSTPKEAYQLVKYLTSPASEKYIFKQTGNLPSQPALYASPAVTNFKNPFFNNAPVGKIFTDSAKKLKPQITGPHQGDVQTAATNAIQRVEQGKQSPAQSWTQFLKDVKSVDLASAPTVSQRRARATLRRPGASPAALEEVNGAA